MTSSEQLEFTAPSELASLAGEPTFAVVIASRGSRAWLSECLTSLIPQCLRAGAELVVPRADTPEAIVQLSAAYPCARFIFAPPRTTIPELRSAGLATVSASLVAFLDDLHDQTIPDDRWLERRRRRRTERRSDGAQPLPWATAADVPSGQDPYLSVVVPARKSADALRHSLEALSRSDLPRADWELIVVDDASTDETALVAAHFADTLVRLTGAPRGPAYARNRGFEHARGECVAFIDANACVHRDTLSRFAHVLRGEPDVSAVFGSYDTHPAAGGLVTQYRNLLLHYHHRQSAGPAETFWASCGAVRSAAFAEAGMFDEWHFPRRQVEDFELGYQLRQRGHRIVSRPDIQSTHLGRWTLTEMIAADLQDRTVPWMRVFHRQVEARARRGGRRRGRNLNAALAWLALGSVVGAALAGRAEWLLTAAACVLAVLFNDRRQYRYFARERGPSFALAVVPLQLLVHLTSGAAIALGWLLRELLGEPTPTPTVEAYAEVGVRMWPPVPANRTRAAADMKRPIPSSRVQRAASRTGTKLSPSIVIPVVPGDATVTLKPPAPDDRFPLSPIQHGMLYHHLSDPRSDVDLVQVPCELREDLDVDRFLTAWNQVAARHEAFRTRFRWAGVESPVQEVVPHVQLTARVMDWRERTLEEREEAYRELVADDRRHQFDLTEAPAMRFTLVRWADAEWRFLWTLHHLLMDGRSFPLLLCEAFDLYDGRRTEQELPASPKYATYIEWLGRRDRTGEEDHWRELLAGVTDATPLPGGGAILPDGGSGRREQLVRLPADETAAIADFAASIGVTFNTVVQGAWALLLSRHAGVDDVVFGATRVCREGTVPNADDVVGLFINTVPVRVHLSPDAPVRDWLRELRRQHVDVRPHEHSSLTDVERWSGFGAGRRLFESIVVFDRLTLDRWMHIERPEWTGRSFELRDRTPFPLALYGYGGDQLDLRFASDRDRISDETAERVLGHLLTLLREIPRDPARAIKDVPMLTDAERQRQLVAWNATERPVELNRCVHELVEAQVRRTPDRDAVTDGDTTVTYRELDERANRLAHRLRGMGVGADRRVGVCVERRVELVVAVLGILKAGGAYVPLDPDYPAERLEYMARDAGLAALVSADRAGSALASPGLPVVDLTRDAELLAREPAEAPSADVTAGDLAYVIYTSGSTGRPKGVMVEHRNVANFFAAMDDRIPVGTSGTWLAVTSLAFDISVLELLWPLTRGLKVVVASPPSSNPSRAGVRRGPDFSLFYFASGEGGRQEDKYRLLLDGARFADQHGFHAIWTPERHFHAFGGLYPNPSVTAAAVAAITSRVRIRAGSVVLPLHHPIRVAEEWALVDNLSGGRVGISFASGWQPNDFVLAPQHYADRKRVMLEGIEVVRRLWRGESASFPGPDGKSIDVQVLPRPIQAELPVWITTAGSADTYRAAGTAGASVLTHLLGQSVDDLAAMIAVYRDAWSAAGHAGTGVVTLMLHTFVGADESAVRETVREPMKSYLRSSVGLIKGFAGAWTASRRGAGQTQVAGDEFDKLSPEDMDSLLDFAFERYFETSGLFGSQARCLELVEQLQEAGVDEIACLIDFGVPTDEVLSHLHDLDAVRLQATRSSRSAPAPALSTLMREHGVTHLQCTPSLARMLLAEPETRESLGSLEVMLVGGEPLPGALAAALRGSVKGPVINMYGPTETTVWSSTHQVEGVERGTLPIGRPVANTRFHVLDHHGQPAPIGVPGELFIGGEGVVRGYLDRPELTRERFVPDPFAADGSRLYRTGDVVRWRDDGVVEFLGRTDHQVKIRGHRIELGEIEAVLAMHPAVGQVVVNPWQRSDDDTVLVAYVVPRNGELPSEAALRAHVEARLPSAMVPAHLVSLSQLPLTPNGKVDRKALPVPAGRAEPVVVQGEAEDAKATVLEELVAGIWRKVLGVEHVGPRDHFFQLGGSSLTTIQVAMGIRDSLGIDLPLRAVFEAPTVTQLAADLEHRLLEGVDTTALETLLTELEQPVAEEQQAAVT